MKKSLPIFVIFGFTTLALIFFVFSNPPEFITKLAENLFLTEENHNGKLLLAIFQGLTAITILLGVIFGYYQLMNLMENNINEKFKTAIEHFNNQKKEIVYCSISSLHDIALKSVDLRDSIRNLFLESIDHKSVNPNQLNELKCMYTVFRNSLIYQSDKERKSNLKKIDFSDFSISDCKIERYNFTECYFKNVDFSSSTFKNVDFINVIFEDIQFIHAVFTECYFKNVIFKNSGNTEVESDITGAEFSCCKLIDVTFDKNHAKYINFCEFTDMNNVRFKNLSLSGSSFDDSSLNKCIFDNTNLTEVKYNKSRITNCDFHKAINPEPQFLNQAATLKDSIFLKHIEVKLDKNLLLKDYLTS